MHLLGPDPCRGAHAVDAAKAQIQQTGRHAEAPGQLRDGESAVRVVQQIIADLSGQPHLGAGIALLLLRRGKRAEKKQQLQDLHLEIALAHGVRHLVEFGEHVFDPRGGAGGKPGRAATELFDQLRNVHIHILQNAGETRRGADLVEGDGDTVVVAGGKHGLAPAPIPPQQGQIPRGQEIGVLPAGVLRSPLPAVPDLGHHAVRTRAGRHGRGVDIVIDQLNPRENRIGCQNHVLARTREAVDRPVPVPFEHPHVGSVALFFFFGGLHVFLPASLLVYANYHTPLSRPLQEGQKRMRLSDRRRILFLFRFCSIGSGCRPPRRS